jgi:hypothetical protein
MTTNVPPSTQPIPDAGAEPPAESATTDFPPTVAPALDYAALDAAHRALSASLHPANKAALFAVLAAAGIAKVTVEFDGYGDSGQIESVEATGADGLVRELPAISLIHRRAQWGEAEPRCEEMTATETIERLAYDLLGDAHPGWEINDGAYGSFTFDVAGETLTLDCNLRFTASDLHTSTF